MSDDTSAARAYWLSEPCPPWCTSKHRDHDSGDDRAHISVSAHVDLHSEDCQSTVINGVMENICPAELRACLDQQYRETEPRISLSHNGEPEVWLTIGEADELSGKLADLVKAALDAR